MNERAYFEKLIGKFLVLNVQSNDYTLKYSGFLKAVLENQILFDDVKLGEILIVQKDITIRGIYDDRPRS